MLSPVNSILNQATRNPEKPLNILTSFTHEGFESGLCKTGHQFYSFFTKGLKRWNNSRPLSQNYHTLPDDTIPQIDFSCVLSQTRWGQYQALKPIADRLHIPLITLEHTTRMDWWGPKQMEDLRKMTGDIDVFITEHSRDEWGWNAENAITVRHGINTNLFTPGLMRREPVILSVVNDWINRGEILGFDIWKRVTKDLPVHPVGDTKGFSLPSSSTEELVRFYQSSSIFINTSQKSPLPMSVLEAMACGCAVVSSKTCAIPEVITHGVNGFISNDEKELRGYCELLLKDEGLASELGRNARQTILEKFAEERFIREWNTIFQSAATVPYRR